MANWLVSAVIQHLCDLPTTAVESGNSPGCDDFIVKNDHFVRGFQIDDRFKSEEQSWAELS